MKCIGQFIFPPVWEIRRSRDLGARGEEQRCPGADTGLWPPSHGPGYGLGSSMVWLAVLAASFPSQYE